MNKPYLNTETHRLTSLPGEKHPNVCQRCGGSDKPGFGNGLMRTSIDRWQEHDHNDRPEQMIVVLCTKCAKAVIEQHPRLYNRLDPFAPWPGAMALCVACRHRQGVACGHPDAKANGGPGVMLTVGQPIRAMVDGASYRGPATLWPSPPTACRQRAEK